MNTASAPATTAARSVVNDSRPAAILAVTSAASPGSKIGIAPRCKPAIFAASWSTQLTDTPNSEKHAPDTNPTYPVPIIAIRIDQFLRMRYKSDVKCRLARKFGIQYEQRPLF